jgi:hypothetical protein
MFSMNLNIYWEFFFEWDHDKCKGYIKKMKILNFKIWRADLKSLLHIKRHVKAI